MSDEIKPKSKRGPPIKHGMTKTPIYKLWLGMIYRCHRPNDKHYVGYGSRGIYVCERWRESFKNFFDDMGFRPKNMMLDRIDNDGPYSPENCRWTDPITSSNNRSTSVHVTMDGETKTFTEWIRYLGLPYGTIRRRVYVNKWDHIKALKTPINHKMYSNRKDAK